LPPNNSRHNSHVAAVSPIITASFQSWLKAPAVNGLGIYDLEIDRDDIGVQAEGIYQGTLTVKTVSNNTVIIDVIMQVNASLQFGDVGHLYVRLIDTATAYIREVEADVQDGQYHWEINDLPPGNYQLVSFTDADYDGRVCDVGEACGAYPTIDQPEVIDLQTDIAALDYSLNYLNFGVELGVISSAPK
jgi:serine protease